MRLLLLSLSGLLLTGLLIYLFVNFGTGDKKANEISVASIMSGEVSGFKKADSIRQFIFPKDHFAHNEYRTEWWYFTGNLFTQEGRRFGYQFTIFRNGILPGSESDS
ncbi:MAG: carotenoid 1,2-hydratase, partial [Ignavibacteriaceae bacterium]|nr:carotenoid 1,2-hydratase [Ignavibacteriaceae bacterium]